MGIEFIIMFVGEMELEWVGLFYDGIFVVEVVVCLLILSDWELWFYC